MTAADGPLADPADGAEVPRPDVRLLPLLAASWVSAAWATARTPATAIVLAAGCLALGPIVLALAARRPGGARRGAAVVLALAGAALVLVSAAAQTTVRTRAPMPQWTADRTVVEAWGRVVTDPHRVALTAAPRFAHRDAATPDETRYTLRMRLERVSARGRTVAVDAPVLLIGDRAWADVGAGQHLTLTARLDVTEPGDDVVAVARAMGPPRGVTPGGPLWRLADRLRAGLREACSTLPEDAGGLLPSLVVGDTSRLPERLRTDLQTSGLTHLTAVSGANVAIVAGAVLWTATWGGVRRPVRLGLAIAVVACFVVVARPQPSVLRAAVMGGVALLGLGLSRRPRGLPALAAAGTVLLVVDPWLSRSAGFALSCVATGALLVLAPVWTSRWSRRLPVPVAAALAVPAAAQAACGPVVVLLTPSVSLAAVPANLLAEPAVAPATVLGVLAAVVAPWWAGGAHALAWVGSLATGWIARVAHAGAALPFAGVPWPSGIGGAALLAVLTAGLVAVSLWPRRTEGVEARRHRRPAGSPLRPGRPAPALLLVVGAITAAVLGWLLVAPVPWWPGPGPIPVPWPGRVWPPTEWEVVQCDVGQGSATVVRSGPDRAVLVDAGPEPAAVDHCLRRLGVRHLDLVVLTHHHADHVLGLPGALHGRDAALVLVSPLPEPAGQAADVRRVAAAAAVPVAEGWAGASGGSRAGPWAVRWRLLAPSEPPVRAPPGEGDDGTVINESSLALLLEVSGPGGGTLRVVGLGDLEITGQERLLRRLHREAGGAPGGAPGEVVTPVDVLVVAHHGSARQVPGLCRELAPRVAVIGVGAGNDYGHPAPSALAMLRDCGAAVYRTDRSGAVALVAGGEGRLAAVPERPTERPDGSDLVTVGPGRPTLTRWSPFRCRKPSCSWTP